MSVQGLRPLKDSAFVVSEGESFRVLQSLLTLSAAVFLKYFFGFTDSTAKGPGPRVGPGSAAEPRHMRRCSTNGAKRRSRQPLLNVTVEPLEHFLVVSPDVFLYVTISAAHQPLNAPLKDADLN